MPEKGPFAEVEPLVRAGRYKEALGALKRSARSGAQAWETYLWLGRIEESRGRPRQAQDALRKALTANPGSPLPRVELSRLFEKAGRSGEARALLEEAAAQAAGELSLLSDGLLRGDGGTGQARYRVMEFNSCRKVFLEEVVRKGEGLDRIEAAIRAVLKRVPQPGARTLLAEVLIERSRLPEAEAELAAAFAPGVTGGEASRIETLLRLIEHGGYGPRIASAVSSCLARARDRDKIALSWPQIFSALMCAHAYLAAFRLGEAYLDRFGEFAAPGQLLWPWRRKIARALNEHAFILEELARMREAARGGELPHWFSYYRAILNDDLGRDDEALLEYESIRGLDAGRYSWMHQSFVLVKLGMLDYAGAIKICRTVLARSPGHWWVRCRLAEAYLAQGDRAAGLRELKTALAIPEAKIKREVLTWYGEILLWLGDYDRALSALDEAVRLGARTFVFGWRGAARLKRGDGAGALKDLDYAIALDAKDYEARCWRAEAYRLAGRTRKSRQDLDIVIKEAPQSALWAHVNRALLRDAQDDEAGMRADYLAVPADLTSFVSRLLGLPAGREPDRARMRRVLAAALDWAGGLRRWEAYVQPIWRSRAPHPLRRKPAKIP